MSEYTLRHRIHWRLRTEARDLRRHLDEARRRTRNRLLRQVTWDWSISREVLAHRYLTGDGIEIGALNVPQALPAGVRVRYVDHAPPEGLREIYEVNLTQHTSPLVEPDVVDDAARLAAFPDGSVDFVVANHVLEHMEDPLLALESFLRVLRPGGILFLTLPDARFTFDARRPRTTVEHLLRDHREGPEVSRIAHFEECARIVECVPEEKVPERLREFAAQPERIHFHVWELETFMELLAAVDLPADVECIQAAEGEFTTILRKNPDRAQGAWRDGARAA